MTYEPGVRDVSRCARVPMGYQSAANCKEQA
jgi:hypothetical protein